MLKRILTWTGVGLGAVVVIGAVSYAFRSDPWGPLSGRALRGEVVREPVGDWSWTDAYSTIAVETRPAAPYSVTTVCFTHEGKLYVPANSGSSKSWTHFAVSDPRVRLKIGDEIYPVRATRVTDEALAETLRAAAQAKYDFPPPKPGEPPRFTDVWVFRMESDVDVAAR